MGKIVIHIMPMDHPSKFDLSVGVPVDDFLFREALRKIDFPTDDAGIAAMFCTPAESIEETISVRKGVKAEIMNVISEIVDGWLGKFDTIMGHKKTEDRLRCVNLQV